MSRGIQISGSVLSGGRKILGALTRLTALTRDEKESDAAREERERERERERDETEKATFRVLRLPRQRRGVVRIWRKNLHFYLRMIKRTVTG